MVIAAQGVASIPAQVFTSITMLSCVAVAAVSAASFEDLKSVYIKFVDENVPPEKQQKFKDGFAHLKGCISSLVNEMDFNALKTMTAAVTKAGVECGKSVQDMDETQQQAQFMPCVKEQFQDLMNQKSDADKAVFEKAKSCVMSLVKSPSPT